jgi:hypothetical protein
MDDAVECIQTLGVGTQLIEMSLKSAYRQISAHVHYHLLGVVRIPCFLLGISIDTRAGE